ncbi:ShlB/FhaC/HecB family hemolysin secretion/activation protein [Pseudomonas berkeleyensis]|uniref:ShlB/FhaC/HecB family hemolysin secretion/activation protein n=1 Tax=Pseudomonas berkeleyensis TaxID=2726956 RepID=A0A7G5DML4_9PSED|nr:ShlB/FhaC/HecB family hemolysin secretion/activation protein [Pseudomonas berkeleyensis]QMV62989.1 ShlB/FhaC/HecB family hemolysin secretion/activation protein [Pseudomonas berkeleyensis]WSO38444.1 ShlB/FhaC/HecB family hemolysin secretion/activation protein [Pseudomonas berkeleyensis]
MRLASRLLSAFSMLPFACLANASAADLLSFQEIADLPSRSSLTLGDTHYQPPQDLSAMPFISGAIALDNFGGHDDKGRLATGLNLRGLLTPSDLLSLRSMGSAEEGHYHWGAYHLEIGPWSSRLGFIFSDLSYELGGELEILAAKGKTRTASAFILQPLLASEALSLEARLQFDDKRLQDEIGVLHMNSEKRSRVLDYELGTTAHEPWLNNATTTLALNWREGHLNIEGSPYTLVGKADPGHFSVLRAKLARLQPLSERLSLYVHVLGQWSRDNLDDSEKLYIGGVFGTRSAEQTDAFGDRGWQASAELRYALSDSWQLVAFADHGQARLNTPSLIYDTVPRRLSSKGLGAKWATHAWSISALAGWKVGDHPAQRDSERQPRIWAQLAYRF